MVSLKLTTSVGFMIMALCMVSISQVVPSRPPRTIDPNRPDPATQRWYDELRKRENTPTGIGAIDNKAVVAAAVAEVYEKAKKKLAPTVEEKRIYADFLRQPNTGMFRIGAMFRCEHILDITKPDQECHNQYVPGRALAFSFRRSDYVHDAYSDLRRSNGEFVLSGTYVLGLIAPIGDIPIESVGIDHALATDLMEFSPAEEVYKVADQDIEIGKGLKIGDLVYGKAVPIREHTTYLLRSVAYRARFLNLPKSESARRSLDQDVRSDVTVVLRVVRKAPDDTYLVLWREIDRMPSPLLTVDVAKQ